MICNVTQVQGRKSILKYGGIIFEKIGVPVVRGICSPENIF